MNYHFQKSVHSVRFDQEITTVGRVMDSRLLQINYRKFRIRIGF